MSEIPAQTLVGAYCTGLFPMALPSGEIGWFSPEPRGIIPLDGGFQIPHGLKRFLKRENPFTVTFDQAFDEVIAGCADRQETWIDDVVLDSFRTLHDLGFAHSAECWRQGKLVGGLYGVSIGGAFFGESMFSRETEASKVALVGLVDRLNERGFTLLDTQWVTRHLRQFGAVEIPRGDYLRRLDRAINEPVTFFGEILSTEATAETPVNSESEAERSA